MGCTPCLGDNRMVISSVIYRTLDDLEVTNIDDNGVETQTHLDPSNSVLLERYGVQAWIDAGNTPTPYAEQEISFDDKRRNAYGSVREQLDMQYWDKKNGTDNWEKHIDKVKSDIAKE